jgi:hypothetical protein
MSTDPRDIPMGGESKSEPIPGGPPAIILQVDDRPLTVLVSGDPSGTLLRFDVPGPPPGGKFEIPDLEIVVSESTVLTSMEVHGPDAMTLNGAPEFVGAGDRYTVGPAPFGMGTWYIRLRVVPSVGGAGGQVQIAVGRPTTLENFLRKLPDWIPFVKKR